MENKELITIDGQSYRKSDIKAKVTPVLIIKAGNVFRRRNYHSSHSDAVVVLAQVASDQHKLITISTGNRQTDTAYRHASYMSGRGFGEVEVDAAFHQTWELVAPSLKAYFAGVK